MHSAHIEVFVQIIALSRVSSGILQVHQVLGNQRSLVLSKRLHVGWLCELSDMESQNL